MPLDEQTAVKLATDYNRQQFQPIDGTLTPEEATRILCSLVKSKIDYHSLEKASSEERFGKHVSHSERRLSDLKKLDA